MKVQARNGRWYTRDHPHEIISPHVMRFEEIRYWLRVLVSDPAYGWAPRGENGLERALGMNPDSMRYKLTTGWIWPKEQVRLTARINEILDGYIVPTRYQFGRVEGVYTDPPRPPVVNRPRMIHMQVTVDGVRMVPHKVKPPPRLPDFHEAFARTPTWKL